MRPLVPGSDDEADRDAVDPPPGSPVELGDNIPDIIATRIGSIVATRIGIIFPRFSQVLTLPQIIQTSKPRYWESDKGHKHIAKIMFSNQRIRGSELLPLIIIPMY